MKTFRQFVESIESIPLSKYNHNKGNLEGITSNIEKQLSGDKTPTEFEHSINPKELKRSQNGLSQSGEGGGDPVFPDLQEYPVVAHTEDGHVVIDGHHRVADALSKNRPKMTVYHFDTRSK